MEAALYAVSLPYVRHRAESGHAPSAVLLAFKQDMGKPIAAILILNTVAHTAGASVAGWIVGELYGASALLPFSIAYTLAVLYLSEILPKLIGVVHSKSVATIIAIPLALLVRLLLPLIWLSDFMAKRIRSADGESISEQEVLSMASMGEAAGAIDALEGSVISNIVSLDRLLVKDVMTPRVVVVRAPSSKRIKDLIDEMREWNYSRIPLVSGSNNDYVDSYVTQRDLLWEVVRGNVEREISEIGRPIKTVPDTMRCDKLLLELIAEREHICSVVDEHGSLVGIITLEDIIEEIVGKEILDEYDSVGNLRALARLNRLKRVLNREQK
jgi:CBS domain containing-hemolysin-like protein